MQVSAEIRWFWHKEPPPDFKDWFCSADSHPCPAGGGGQPRRDVYLSDPSQVELGLKVRGGGGFEVKGLVAITQEALAAGPFAGPIEIWAKWPTKALTLGQNATIATEKLRWLRKFDTTGSSTVEVPLDEKEKPRDSREVKLGCNVELTQVKLPNGDVWWTLGFEAFDAIWTVEGDLRKVADTLAGRLKVGLAQGMRASYPAWLAQYAAVG